MKSLLKIKNIKIVISIGFLCVIIPILFLKYRSDDLALSPIKEIRFNESGLSPRRLVVNMGDVVTFINDSTHEVWPASDPHPTHNVDPQFDTRRPLKPNDTWTYSFQNPGVWKFHDHLASVVEGEIVVLSKTGKVVLPDCKNKNSTPSECYQIDVVGVLKKEGLEKALDRMAFLYNNEPAFKDSCHAVSHILGKSAYHVFEEGGTIKLTGKTSYCSYGFYHGFMEEMLQLSGNLDDARKFCTDAGKILSKESANAEGACYHGIGHGAADGSDPRAWGNPIALVSPGIELCNKVDSKEPHFYRCVSGVFNSLALMYMANSYNLRLDSVTNPFEVCKNWDEFRIKNPCYQEMNTLGMRLAQGDLKKGIHFVEKIDDENKYAALAMRSLSGVVPSRFKQPFDEDFENTIDACHSARKDLVVPCLQGIPSGIMEFGTPGKEYEAAVAFCMSEKLLEDERIQCIKMAFGGIRAYYPPEKQASICATIDIKYRKLCVAP
ncbi:MAG: hypothetical protein RLZZ67_264 [Candidatus Parcubacteria bacterium]|jgi:plastocyanin